MGVFHVFKIVHMVPYRATHHNYANSNCDHDFLGITTWIFSKISCDAIVIAWFR